MLPAARWAFGPHAADDQPDQASVHGLPGGPCTPVLLMTSRIRSLCIHCLPWVWAGQMSARIRGPILAFGTMCSSGHADMALGTHAVQCLGTPQTPLHAPCNHCPS